MSDTAGRAPLKTALRSHIDRLATKLVLGEEAASFDQELKELSRRAGECGFTETSSFAFQLIKSLRSSTPESGVDAEHIRRQGLILLQDVLSDEPDKIVRVDPEAAMPAKAAGQKSLAQDPELVGDFIMESREHLSSIEGLMLELEQNRGAADAIHSVFRSFHTIKGLAGFLGFPGIQRVSHEVETLLDVARNGKISMHTGIVDVVLESADYLKQSIDAVESEMAGGCAEPVPHNDDLIVRIRGAAELVASPPIQAGEAPPKVRRPNAKSNKAADFSVRVETRKLDSLMDLVGEMVITQSLVRNNPSLNAIQNPRLLADLAQLARITAEVQRTTMGMRMIPIGQLFQRTARMVRDLARKTGKKVELETSGEETEVDKNIAEELSDPMLHMVRNSLDHGIEFPAERQAAGKDPTARIRLAAYHQAGQIVVEISDDGRGLNKAKIIEQARHRGLIQAGTPLSDNEIYQLIFEPGFSTAEKITDISGRGVGMDVVRKNVQKLRGRIDIQSAPGLGAKFLLCLPLTLAIIDGLVVAVGDHRYILPIFDVREIIRPTTETISSVPGRDEVALVRDRLLPVVRLYRRFGVKPRSEEICDGLLVVAECEGKQFCLLVDDLLGKQEVVIKSLGETFKNIKGIAGCAILGDGRVGLILDLHGVFPGNRQ
jgi:two-component system, chemotaxis family, sensor kinase CheA